MTDIVLTKPQYALVTHKSQFPAMVAGFGAGKTHALLCRAIALKLKYPKQNIAYYLPTYDLIKTIAFPRFTEMLEEMGIGHKLNRQDAFITIDGGGMIVFRTMDRPERIVGYEVADSLVDELDTLKTEKAREVWEKVISRNRQKKPDGSLNTVAVGTTPEGFRFVYERWKRNAINGYELIKASTYSNAANLPDGYIESLINTYPSNRLSAYLDGEFVNLTSGSVYTEFDRKKNAGNETIRDNETLHIGMDFNVGNMAASVHVLRDDCPHAVNEFTGVLDTPAMIALIKREYEGHKVIVYPDASGKSRKSVNASESDLSLLRAAGFQVFVNNRNPAVKDRILSVNVMLGDGRYKINIDNCPHLVEGLEKQAYDKNGEPDKTSGLDHICFSGDTLVETEKGVFKISEIPERGFIRSPFGNFVKYNNAGIKKIETPMLLVTMSDGSSVKCTPDHKFLTWSGEWVQAKNLKSKYIVKRNKNIGESFITYAVDTFKIMVSGFTEKFGKIITALFQKVKSGIYTTRIITRITTKLKTLNYYISPNITKSIKRKEAHNPVSYGTLVMGMRLLKKLKNGTLVTKVKNGIKNIIKKNVAIFFMKSGSIERAKTAKKILKHRTLKVNFAQEIAKQQPEENLALMILRLFANVVRNLKLTNTQEKSIVPVFVKKVEQVKNENAYCLTVKKHGSFTLADGTIVSNCDAAGYFITYRYPIAKQQFTVGTTTGL